MDRTSLASLSNSGIAEVATAIRETAAAEIVPRFQRLAEGDIEEKAPGEIVTAADRACETALTARLTSIADIPVIGEEAVADNPGLLDVLRPETTCWLVDPLDGTANFAAGSPRHAVMVAYLHHGVTAAAWIWQPAFECMYIAERGAGATVDDVPIPHGAAISGDRPLAGVIKERFLPDGARDQIRRAAAVLGPVLGGTNCAGIEYPDLVVGETDYILYWRTLPWDHAPGVLLASETGRSALRPNATNYQPHSRDSGLLVAPAELAEEIRLQLFEAENRPADS